ncbi:MAG: GTPase [Nanoarchaeota archaeon]
MPVNASYEFANAEKQFQSAQTDEERLEGLEEMLRTVPRHKGSENIIANLRTRYTKLKDKIEKLKSQKKGGGGVKFSVKKGDMQVTLVGLTNSGKSSILKLLTNANPHIAPYAFTTQTPEVGILYYENCQIQIIDLPAIGADTFDTGIINTSDTVLEVVEKISDIPEVEKVLTKFKGKRIVVFTKIDKLDFNTKRKTLETLKTKKYNFVMLSARTEEGLDELKEKIFKSFNKIRVYTKQPGRAEHDNEPVIMLPNSTVEQIARIIFKGRTDVIKRTRIWGPSSKFGGQEVGVKHVLKDKDILEFLTR